MVGSKYRRYLPICLYVMQIISSLFDVFREFRRASIRGSAVVSDEYFPTCFQPFAHLLEE